MPRIIPIRDLKNTAAVSQMCSESKEPVYITKNGYGDMVIMSMEAYEERCSFWTLTPNWMLPNSRWKPDRHRMPTAPCRN